MAEGKIYTPREAAKKLGISVAQLRYLRNTGRAEGTDAGNTTLFTEEQIANVDMTPLKSGPKPREKKELEETDPLSMMLIGNGQPREREAVA
jgi:hypothetical protein